jgi:superfamily I DNA/RNA helicase
MYSHFPISLKLPAGERGLLPAASAAVHSEYVESVHWKELVAQRVRIISREGLRIAEIDVGHVVHFDWTWEGAKALAAPALGELDAHITPENAREQVSRLPGGWWGDVVELDAAKGLIYLDVTESKAVPARGPFYVHPFEFLAQLDYLYSDPAWRDVRPLLAARLNASLGSVHPLIAGLETASLPELREVWRRQWVNIWGPPGTGKTALIGRQVARMCADPNERVLVVSTTNAATDEAAVAIGSAEESRGRLKAMVRVGRNSSLARFRQAGLEPMLEGTEVTILEEIGRLLEMHRSTLSAEERASMNAQLHRLRQKLANVAAAMFANVTKRVVVSTAFTAVSCLHEPEMVQALSSQHAPFTTIVIDEAGLLPKATIAALSLLASRRVVLVGDPLQLSPITKVSRILPASQQQWMGSSALEHLQDPTQAVAGVHLLEQQHRMHPEICSVVSAYQYHGRLRSAPTVLNRAEVLPDLVSGVPRAVWFCIDADGRATPQMRAERGPGGRSYLRSFTRQLLETIFRSPGMADTRGLFVTPFVAQARAVTAFFAERNIKGWSAGTVHSQQGVSTDMVIFDTVHGGSTAWSYAEWKRLITVAISRARYFAMVVSTRDEMRQPFLRPLADSLAAVTIRIDRTATKLVPFEGAAAVIEAAPGSAGTDMQHLLNSPRIGDQLAARKAMRSLVSTQQQQLVNLRMDGGPRLVRGVAGSGKTFVLARWLVQVAQRLQARVSAKIWVVYANASLDALVRANIAEAEAQVGRDAVALALEKVSMLHVRELLDVLEREHGMPSPATDKETFDYNERARRLLQTSLTGDFETRCAAMFIDEAQDMGADTLKLLIGLIEPDSAQEPKLRPAHIFLDNAQNIYDRPVPRWAELGLDMRGRSTVMKESFRSTNPVTEFALNAFFRLKEVGASGPQDFDDEDHKELYERELIEPVKIQDGIWWRVRFNDVGGPAPELHLFRDHLNHDQSVAQQVHRWITDQHVAPEDIVVLCNRKADCEAIAEQIQALAQTSGYECRVLTNRRMSRDAGIVLVTTPHSFKGYDAEIIVVAYADHFCTQGQVLTANLYVAITRARSLLWIAAVDAGHGPGHRILNVLRQCLDITSGRGMLQSEQSEIDLKISLRDNMPDVHHKWMSRLLSSHPLSRKSIYNNAGELLAEPLFQIETSTGKKACFLQPPAERIVRELERQGIQVIATGDEVR